MKKAVINKGDRHWLYGVAYSHEGEVKRLLIWVAANNKAVSRPTRYRKLSSSSK